MSGDISLNIRRASQHHADASAKIAPWCARMTNVPSSGALEGYMSVSARYGLPFVILNSEVELCAIARRLFEGWAVFVWHCLSLPCEQWVVAASGNSLLGCVKRIGPRLAVYVAQKPSGKDFDLLFC